MKSISLAIFAALLLSAAVGIEVPEKQKEEDPSRDKRDFLTIPHDVPIYPVGSSHLLSPLAPDTLHRNAVHASAAAARAAQFSKAAHAAQSVAFGESSLSSKASAAVGAAEKTYNIAVSLAHKLRSTLVQAETLISQVWKSLEGAKVVEAAQSAMVYEAQRVADALSQKHFLSLSELQAAQAAAVKAQAVASKALSFASPKDGSGVVYSDDDHGNYS